MSSTRLLMLALVLIGGFISGCGGAPKLATQESPDAPIDDQGAGQLNTRP